MDREGQQVTSDAGARTVDELRDELDRLRAAAEHESAASRAAEARAVSLEDQLRRHQSRSSRAYEAIRELREELDALRTIELGAQAGGNPVSRQPEHSSGAPRTTASNHSHPPGRWLERALQQLARRSPSLAGRLLVVLVPGAEMDQERLVHLLAAGRVRRGRARARGEAPSFDALKRRLSQRVSIAELRLEPGLSFALAAVMIDPHWTAGEHFTIAYRLPSGGNPGPYLEVHDGAPATVSGEPDPAQVRTTIACPADLLTAVLAGQRPAGTTITGDERPLELVRRWLERAQSV
jgi:hypothetical protein